MLEGSMLNEGDVKMSEPYAAWSPPYNFDEYRLMSLIGRGGMGEVYLGHDSLLDRPVAIKFIRTLQSDAEMREQILNEARTAARIQHPNIPSIYRVGDIEGHPYIISEYIQGRSLDLLSRPMPWQTVLKLSIGLCRALAAAHRRGVLHRDIKPGNAIVSENDEIKLLDFGLAKVVDVPSRQEDAPRPVVSVRMPALTHAAAQADGAQAGAITSDHDRLDADVVTQEFVPAQPITIDGINAPQWKTPEGATPISAVPQMVTDMGSAPTMQADLRVDSGRQQLPRNLTVSNRQTAVGVLKGTPVYMAPELWLSQQASRRSDVYSMGVLMYELCSGDPPYALVPIDDLPLVITSQDAPPLLSVAPDVKPELAAIIDRCLSRDPAERYPSGEELREALEALQRSGLRNTLPEGNPYRGLMAFEAEHRMMFFGRDNEIGTVIERLRSESFVLIAADSGLGKSSLCRAGVLPRVEEGALGSERRWEAITLLPGRHPLHALALALSPILKEPVAAVSERIQRQPAALASRLDLLLGRERGLLLFIDQMEEFISISIEEEAAAVATVLGAMTDRLASIRLLGTARSDFLARLTTLPVIGDELSHVLYLLRPLSRAKLRDVIVGPAAAKGVHFESDGLVEMLIDSTVSAEGGLPLLQFALAELWDAHKEQSITAMALADIGGVTGALARHADSVLMSLLEDQRRAARGILMQLVTAEGTRARRRESELLKEPGAGPALNALLQGRLLVVRDIDVGTVYEVAHEALIKGWGTLRHWLDEQAESRQIKQSLERTVANWQRLGRAPEALWGQRQLSEASLLSRDLLTPNELEFLAASKAQLKSSRLLTLSLIGLVPLALLILYVVGQIKVRYDLNERVTRLASQGRAFLQQARRSNSGAILGRQRAFWNFDRGHQEQGEEDWTQVHLLEADANQHYNSASQMLEAALTFDTARGELRDLLGEVLYERTLLAGRSRTVGSGDDLVQRLTLYDTGGKLLELLDAPGRLHVRSNPAGASITIAQYLDSAGQKQLTSEHPAGVTPLEDLRLGQGSYLLTFRAPGRADVRYPVLVERDEELTIDVTLPKESELPPSYVYIPSGRFLFGTSTDDTLRKSFLTTVPLHAVKTPAYIIAKHETTYADWIAYLKATRPATGRRQGLKVEPVSMTGALSLTSRRGVWSLTLQVANHVYHVREGVPLIYENRKARAAHDWLRMPVAGITREEAIRYAAWLDQSGQLPGARLCTDYEWERAARGADGRQFPGGDELTPVDANFDATYGKDPALMGPDEIGLYPTSRSPFGVDDMAGNVFEWVTSSLDPKQAVARGGGYSYGSFTCRSSNRTLLDPEFRDPGLGLRICASWPLPHRSQSAAE